MNSSRTIPGGEDGRLDAFVLGVDLDGVCADYNKGFRWIAARHLGVEESSLPDERGWDFAEWGLSRDEFDFLHRQGVLEERMFRRLDLIEGAAETLWRLSDAGVWIRIITHRLYQNWSHKIVVFDTVEWLDRTHIPYRDICFLGAKPEVEADLYVDDSPFNISALRSAGNEAIVFDQTYNRGMADPRASTWLDVEEIVMDRFTNWSGTFGVQPTLPGVNESERLRGRIPELSDDQSEWAPAPSG